jgi:RHS repeat-associated protein
LTDTGGHEIAARLYVRDQDGASLFETGRSAGSTADNQFIYGPDGLTAFVFGGISYRVVSDHLGSSRRVVDENGTVVASFDYGPSGVTIKQGGSQPDILLYRYTGQEFDSESGLYNYRARFYDAELGRFIDVDPMMQGASPYAYVLDDPINQSDPTGEFAWVAFLIIVAISAIVGAVAGAITYAVTHEGNFNVGKFFLYALTGAVAGAASGAAGYFGGVIATGALAAIGVSTSTSFASGIIVGAAAGAADGAVSGVINQMGVNLIEGRQLSEGLGQAAWMGAAIGGGIGGALGGVTGVANRLAARPNFDRPVAVIGHEGDPILTPNRERAAQLFAKYRNVPYHITPGEVDGSVGNALGMAGRRSDAYDRVIAVVGHGNSSEASLFWRAADAIGEQTQVFANRLQTAVNRQGVSLSGIDLMSCFGYSNGSARALARTFQVPVRAGTDTITFAPSSGKAYIAWWRSLFRGGVIRTYYPSQLRTSWNYLFGY